MGNMLPVSYGLRGPALNEQINCTVHIIIGLVMKLLTDYPEGTKKFLLMIVKMVPEVLYSMVCVYLPLSPLCSM